MPVQPDSYLTGVDAPPEEQPGVLGKFGDVGKAVGASVLGTGADLAAAARYGFEAGNSPHGADISNALMDFFQTGEGKIADTLSPAAKKAAAYELTSPEFLEHPIFSLGLKAAGAVGPAVALALPGGLLTDAALATMTAAAGFGAVNSGAGLRQFYTELDKISDEKLQAQSDKYKALREMYDEPTARAKYNNEMQSYAPIINTILGAAAGAVGPIGMGARALAGGKAVLGGVERGALGRAAIGGVEGAGVNAVQTGVGDVLQQQTEINAHMQDQFDLARAANKAFEGGAVGGLMGGAIGLVARGGPHGAPKVEEAPIAKGKAKAEAVTSDAATPQPKATGASLRPAPPAEEAPVGEGNGERSEVQYGKGDTKTKPPRTPQEVAPIGVDAAIAQATGAMQGTPNETIAALTAGEKVQAPVTPGGNAPPVDDRGTIVSETKKTLQEQLKQIGQGQRKAVEVPNGTVVGGVLPKGSYERTREGGKSYVFDPKLISRKQIRELVEAGRQNEFLGLGPVSKTEAMARAAQGEPPVAVTERTPEGTEVKAAAGTAGTAPAQVASLEAQKTPGNVVATETPQAVVGDRVKAMMTEAPPPAPSGEGPPRTGRVLRNLTQIEETAPLKGATKEGEAAIKHAEAMKAHEAETAKLIAEGKTVKELPVEPQEPKVEKEGGKRYSEKEKAQRNEKIAKAEKITNAHPPDVEGERDYARNPEIRDKIIARAQSMLDAAKKVGLSIQAQLKKSEKGDALSDHPSIQILRAAKDLEKVASKNKQGVKRTEAAGRFAEAERLIRGGGAEEVRQQRLEEGDAARRRSVAGEDVAAGKYTEEAPKAEIGAEPDVTAPTKVGTEDVVTSTAASAKMGVRGIEAPEEVREVKTKEGHVVKEEVAKAASEGVSLDEAKARAIAKQMGFEYKPKVTKGAPEQPPAIKPRARINLNPTEPQKVAGNYSKGHRFIEGLRYTIENPLGALRKGIDALGKAWQTRMPADYGYIRGTKGADGDHIDAYDLKSGKRHFVIDQLEHPSGAFDEHKVMLRAKDEQHALETYEKSFSDGHGRDRVGNVHEVTMPELKTWLDRGDTEVPITKHISDEAGVEPEHISEEAIRHKLRELEGARELPPKVSIQNDKGGMHEPTQPLRSSTLGAELEKLELAKEPGIVGELQRFLKRRLLDLSPDTQVHFIDTKEMTRIAGEPGENVPGLHGGDINGRGHIFINVDRAEYGHHGEGSFTHNLLHEAMHEVSVRELLRGGTGRGSWDDRLTHMADVVRAYMEHPDNALRIALDYQGSDLKYAFKDAHEFLAESFSNPAFQRLLSEIKLDPETSQRLGLHANKTNSMWDGVRNAIKDLVFGKRFKGERYNTALDGMLRLGEGITSEHEVTYARKVRAENVVRKSMRMSVEGMEDGVKRILEDALNRREPTPRMLGLRTFDYLARTARSAFGLDNPVEKIHEANERMRVAAQKIFEDESGPIIKKMVEMRAKDTEAFTKFAVFLHDLTRVGVHPDVELSHAKNAFLGKDKVVGRSVWQKVQHGDLAREYREIIKENPEYEGLYHEVVKHFSDQQNAMTRDLIKNSVGKLFGHEDAALADRIHTGTVTDADRAALGANLDVIERAGELSKIDGPYAPLMRRGDHVVKGTVKVDTPMGAKRISGNEFEFGGEKEAVAYAKSSDLQATVKKVWVNDKTGETFETDPATNKERKVLATDTDSVPRYRVEVQNTHMEYIQGRRAAERRADELRQNRDMDIHEVVPRAYEPDGRLAVDLSASLSNFVKKLEHSEAYKQSSPTQQAAMRRSIEEVALAAHGSTRISSKALPRRNVMGASDNIIQNTVDYGVSSSRYRARLQHAPALEAGVKEMQDRIKQDHSKSGQYNRELLAKEVLKRINGDNGFQQNKKYAPAINRALALSSTDKLGSPAYSIVNGLQPAMITMPYLAAKHGPGRAFKELSKAYSDIGSWGMLKAGFKETGRRIMGREAPEDFITSITKKMNDDERRMIQHHIEIGLLDPDAGLEASRIAKTYEGAWGKVDRMIGYLEGVTREMPRTIEAINRAATALAAYRLERQRGASHEQALKYSVDANNETQFNYAPTNSAPLFNHPLYKLALQFKKYPQGVYQLLGSQVAKVIHNENPGDRAQGVKMLIGIAATHMAVAGALGLPTEPFKWLLWGAHIAGLTKMSWADVENKIREEAASVFGKTGGEVLTRGLPRLLNVDLSRAGIDNLLTYSEPQSGKMNDILAWMFKTTSGPVAALGVDWGKGVNQMGNGDFVGAAENLFPLKTVADSIKAYRLLTEGKKTAAGKQTMTPYTPTEAAMRVLGFGSGREAEAQAATSAYYSKRDRQKEERGALMNAWTQADNAGKTKAWAAIQKYNKDQPEEVKITAKELTQKAVRDKKQAETAKLGINPSKRDKRFLAEGSIYNTGAQ